jgi:hypothetical protein
MDSHGFLPLDLNVHRLIDLETTRWTHVVHPTISENHTHIDTTTRAEEFLIRMRQVNLGL